MKTLSLAEALDEALQKALKARAPLDGRLAMVRDAVRTIDPHFAGAVDRMVTRLQKARAGEGAPRVGEKLAPFILPDTDGHLTNLESLLAHGPAVVAFHRGQWCPYCRIHAKGLGEVAPRIAELGARMVAIAPDRQKFNASLRAQGGERVSILTDIDNGYALSIGLAVYVGDEMKDLMDSSGFSLENSQGNSAWLLPIPATFVLSRSGAIVARDMDPDYRRRMDLDVLIEAVRAAMKAE